MKLIEALKQIKDLKKKAEDLRLKVQMHSAYSSIETPVYPDQKAQVSEWIQAHSDILKEILRLTVAIQKTNLETMVTVELGGKTLTKSIAEWIHRRRELANLERDMWRKLTDKGLQEGHIQQSTGQAVPVTIVRCYDPKQRDNMISLFDSEPVLIDSKLEIANAITDLIE